MVSHGIPSNNFILKLKQYCLVYDVINFMTWLYMHLLFVLSRGRYCSLIFYLFILHLILYNIILSLRRFLWRSLTQETFEHVKITVIRFCAWRRYFLHCVFYFGSIKKNYFSTWKKRLSMIFYSNILIAIEN